MKKYVFMMMCALCALTMSAQRVGGGGSYSNEPRKVTFGVRAGLNVANVDENFWDEKWEGINKSKSLLGFKVGAICDIPVWQDLSMQPGLYVSMKGGKVDNMHGYYSNDVERKRSQTLRPIYLDVPILAVYHIRLANGLDLQPAFGPYFSFGVGGKRTYADNDPDDPEEEKFDIFGGRDDDDYYYSAKMLRRFDCGLTFGFGASWHQFYAGLNYDLGLYNTYNEYFREYNEKNSHCKNRVLTISVGYNF